jgi:hypothetical protein
VRFFWLQVERGFRGVKRCSQWTSSPERLMPSIQPKARASMTASSQVMDGMPLAYL